MQLGSPGNQKLHIQFDVQVAVCLAASLVRVRDLPQRPVYIEHNRVDAEPLLVTRRKLLHIVMPCVRCDDGTRMAKEESLDMLARWAVPQVDCAQRMLEYLTILGD